MRHGLLLAFRRGLCVCSDMVVLVLLIHELLWCISNNPLYRDTVENAQTHAMQV